MFPEKRDDRCLEDYVPGDVHRFGALEVTEQEIVEFARQYDPQYFHTDPDIAATSPFGSVIASGFHNCAMAMRMLVDHYLPTTSALTSPGVDDLRWLKPVKPGDRLSLQVTVASNRRSKSKPDRGIVHSRVEMLNQQQEVVMHFVGIALMLARNPQGE